MFIEEIYSHSFSPRAPAISAFALIFRCKKLECSPPLILPRNLNTFSGICIRLEYFFQRVMKLEYSFQNLTQNLNIFSEI